MGWILSPIRRAHAQFLAEHDRMTFDALQDAGRHGVDHVQQFPAFKPRTGALQKATQSRVIKTAGGRLVRLSNAKRYAEAIDTGARPHVIAARNAPLLVFFWKKKGIWMRTRKVNHPGNKPYKFMYRAYHSAGRVAEQHLATGMARVAKRF